MTRRANLALTLSAAAGAGLLVATAYAQQSPPGNPPPPANPAPQTNQAPPPPPPPGPRADRDQGPNRDRGPGGMSMEDRAAFFDARLAAIRAGLKLTPEQDALWPPVESAVREMARTMMELRQQRETEPRATEPLDRLAQMGQVQTRRGQAMTRLADAAKPLYASLTDDQKRRLRVLMRHGREMGRGMERGPHGMMGMDRDRDGRGYGRHHDRHHERHGMRDERGRDDRGYGRDRDRDRDMDRDMGPRGRDRDDRRGGWDDGRFGGNDWR